MELIEFAVPGTVVAEGSLAPNWGGRPCGSCGRRAYLGLRPQLRGLDQWRDDVARLATRAMRGRTRLRYGVGTELIFVMKPPKTIPKDRRHPTVPPDIDKLERAVHDAMNGIVYVDDAQVVRAAQEQRYPLEGEIPGVIVRVRALDPDLEAERPELWEQT